jgi:hypothetical protein
MIIADKTAVMKAKNTPDAMLPSRQELPSLINRPAVNGSNTTFLKNDIIKLQNIF